MSAAIEQRNQEATCYVGNLDEKVNEEILWELMIQVGPVVNVHIPKDKITGKHQGYGFVEFRGEEDAEYAMKILNMVKLYQKPIKMNKSSQDKRQMDVGANLFIGNLDPEVDEKLLYDTFSAFGGILTTPRVMRDPETGISKGYGFVSFDSFESSDFAIECMNGQYLCNRPIVVQYGFKKDTPGERHGSQAERLLAASQPKIRPHTIFSGGQGDTTVQIGNPMNMNMMTNVPPPPSTLVPPPPPPPLSLSLLPTSAAEATAVVTMNSMNLIDPQYVYQMQMYQQMQYAQSSIPNYMMPSAGHPTLYNPGHMPMSIPLPPPPPPPPS